MNGEKGRKVYLFDGTKEGFLSAVFYAYNQENAYLAPSDCFQAEIFDEVMELKTEFDKAERVGKKLFSISQRGAFETLCVLRTEEIDRAQTAFLYAKTLVSCGASARQRLTENCVRRALDLSGKVLCEVHRLKGFLRFRETEQGVYYAPCEPDNDIVDLLLPHFRARLAGQAFVIHDIKRGVAAIHDGKNIQLANAQKAEIILSEKETAYAALWKKYYQTVAIESRKNLKQQKNYMPVRYWRTLVEEPWRQ